MNQTVIPLVCGAAIILGGCGGAGKDAGKPRSLTDREACAGDASCEALADQCEAGEGDSCWRLGARFGQGDGVAADPERAAAIHLRSCDRGLARSCSSAAWSYREGKGVERNARRAVELARKACDGGDCLGLGDFYLAAEGVEADSVPGQTLQREACKQGDALSCYNLASKLRSDGLVEEALTLYERSCELRFDIGCDHFGASLIAHPDPDRAVQGREVLDQTCRRGFASSCVRLAALFRKGTGVEADARRAAELYERACASLEEMGGVETAASMGAASACVQLARMVHLGDGVARDPQRELKLLERACSSGEMDGCSSLGAMYLRGEHVERDAERAVKLYEEACSGGSNHGCFNLAAVYSNGADGVRKDPRRALELLQVTCDGGLMAGCRWAGFLYMRGSGDVEADLDAAVAVLTRGCDGDDADSCNQLGWIYHVGRGVAEDDARAVPLFQKACEGGSYNGCDSLAEMYARGQGVARDVDKASELFGHACDAGGHGISCVALGVLVAEGASRRAPDPDLAAELFRKACEMSEPLGCSKLGRHEHESGAGAAEREAGLARMKQACEEHDRACGELALYHLQKKDHVRAAQLARRACEVDVDATSCVTLGRSYLADPHGAGIDRDEAEGAFRQACARGISEGCKGLEEL